MKISSNLRGTGCCVNVRRLLMFLLVFQVNFVVAQESPNMPVSQGEDFIGLVEHLYGSDDDLVNGTLYIPKSRQIAGHPYFLNSEWLNGSVFIHDKTFEDLELKYNLEIDKVILNAHLTDGTIIKILLNSRSIDSFYIQDHLFVNSREIFPTDSLLTFYEVIYSNHLSFIAQHKKIFVADYSHNTPFGKFSDPGVKYYIVKDQKAYKASTKRMFLNYWKPQHRQIKKFMRRNNINFRKAGNDQLRMLVKFCIGISKN